ncbi:MAG: hypothetical protein RBS57_18235 [Desulforhabdus sp.]|jgi:hypothetical protein|nr:hypothetical protein [Desulforhabdus sp.]
MFAFVDKLPYSILIAVSILMLLVPFHPMPHVLEKLTMLKNGTLTEPIDIFDLFFHTFPTLLLVIKALRDATR